MYRISNWLNLYGFDVPMEQDIITAYGMVALAAQLFRATSTLGGDHAEA